MAEFSGMKDTWTVAVVKLKYQAYVVVIGESACRDALGVSDGRWGGTPFASSVSGLVFADYVVASDSTQKSFGLMLNCAVSDKPQFQDNLAALAGRAGFQTWQFPNQGRIGGCNATIASIAERAGEVYFLKEGNFEASEDTKDEVLLNMTAWALAQEHS